MVVEREREREYKHSCITALLLFLVATLPYPFGEGPGVGLKAQTPPDITNYQWAKNVGSTGGSNVGQSIAVDAGGNLYITGYFSGIVGPSASPSAGFDPGARIIIVIAI